MADQYKEEIQTALQNSDLSLAAKMALDYLDKLKSVPLTIGITGASGSGKSTLVNALRGIRNKTEGAAPTGAVETTMEPTEYIHPQNDKIRIWDLPGIGTTNFKADEYLEIVGFDKYDFFIIVSSDRFRENDAKLAQEIQKIRKKFYFVRSKIDNSIYNEKKDDPNLNEEDLLKLVRHNCTKELKKLGFEFPKIFLVSSHELHLYEFKDLWETLEEELPKHQRDVLLLALPIISGDVIEQKRQVLEERIKLYTLVSALGSVVPVSGLSHGVDLGLLLEFATACLNSLGLMPESLQNLSKVSGLPFEDLSSEIKSPFANNQLNTTLILGALSLAASTISATTVETGFGLFGIPFAITVSSFTTYSALKYILKSLSEDAQHVFMKAVGLCTSV